MDFIYQLGGIREDDERMHVQFHNEAGDIEFSPAKARVYDTRDAAEDDLRRALLVPQVAGHERRAEADDPVAEHGPLPQRPAVHRHVDVYPDMDGFWNDLSAAYAQEIAAAARARLHATCRWTTRASRT